MGVRRGEGTKPLASVLSHTDPVMLDMTFSSSRLSFPKYQMMKPQSQNFSVRAHFGDIMCKSSHFPCEEIEAQKRHVIAFRSQNSSEITGCDLRSLITQGQCVFYLNSWKQRSKDFL